MKRSKITKLLVKNLIRQNDQMLEERREERQLAVDRQLIAEDDRRDRADRLVSLLTQIGPGLAAWIVGDPTAACARPEKSGDDAIEDEARDVDLAVDLLALLQTISKAQQDQMELILNEDQKVALQRLIKTSAEQARRAAAGPRGSGD